MIPFGISGRFPLGMAVPEIVGSLIGYPGSALATLPNTLPPLYSALPNAVRAGLGIF